MPWSEQHQDVANAANASILMAKAFANTSVIENKKTFPIRYDTQKYKKEKATHAL